MMESGKVLYGENVDFSGFILAAIYIDRECEVNYKEGVLMVLSIQLYEGMPDKFRMFPLIKDTYDR